MRKTIEYMPLLGEYPAVVMIDKIIYLSKDDTGEVTYIHLVTGEILHSSNSLKTLDARINHAD